jgi:hypothetical protein
MIIIELMVNEVHVILLKFSIYNSILTENVIIVLLGLAFFGLTIP